MSIYAYQLLKGLGLSEQRVLAVLPSIKAEALDVDQVIYRKGSHPEAWIHVVSGLIGAGIPDTDGAIMPINVFGAGNWFGEVAILNRRALMLECICLTPVRILTMPLTHAVEAFEQEAEFARHIARRVAWRAQQQAEMLMLMRQDSPQLRVVMGLALFAEALHNGKPHLPTQEPEDSMDIPLKQSLLASLCGVSRGVFSECVQQLAAAGWIRLNYATLALLNTEGWRKFSRQYRQNRLNTVKPSMQDILLLMQETSEP